MSISTVSNAVQSYLGIQKQAPGKLDAMLQAVVNACGAEIFLDPKESALKKAMQQAGATAMEISKLLVITHVRGFADLIRSREHVQQRDIDCFVANALKETGFCKATILEYTAAITIAVGITTNIFDLTPKEATAVIASKAFSVPMRSYNAELTQFEGNVLKNGVVPMDLSEEQVSHLESLAFVGVPRARRYLGQYLLSNDKRAHTGKAGLTMLKEATEDGDLAAAGIVGDYYYGRMTAKDWAKAYAYYMDTGAAALTAPRRNAVIDIMNQRTFNKKLLLRSVLLLLVACVLLVLAPGHSVFPYATWLSLLGLLTMGGAIIAAVFHYRVKPVDSVVWLPVTILGIFLALMALFILV